jgi:DNA invertase Pin-like site-specific DNA recombinase
LSVNFPASRVLAYASLDESHWDLGRFSFLRLKSYCEQRFYPIQILAEKAHPEAKSRPLWTEMKKRIKNGEVILVIVPSLYQIAGSNLAKLSDFLRLLENHQVKLMVLKDEIDSDRLDRSQILQHFVTTQLSFDSLKGAQT